MVRYFIFVSFLMYTCTIVAQRTCINSPKFLPTDVNQIYHGIFKYNTYIEFDLDKVIIDNVLYELEGWSSSSFNKKEILHKRFNCLYSFKNHNNNISGRIVAYNFSQPIPGIGTQIQHIHFEDCGESFDYLITDDGFFLCINNPIHNFSNKYIDVLALRADSIKEYVLIEDVDTSAYFNIIKKAEIDTVTEEVLFFQSYNELTVVPATFNTLYQLHVNESSTCPSASYDTTDVTYLTHVGYNSLEVIPAQFETVAEEVLAHQDIIYDNYKRTYHVLDTLILSNNYTLDINGVADGCTTASFLNCLDYSLNSTIVKDTILIKDSYDKCADHYFPFGAYCYKTTYQWEHIYEVRYYSKLVFPAYAITTFTPPQYIDLPQVTITNKSELPDSCIILTEQYLPFESLTQPETTIHKIIPAQYTTRSYGKIVALPIVEFNLGEPEESYSISSGKILKKIKLLRNTPNQFSTCMKDDIIHLLRSKDYLNHNPNIDSYTFYTAVIKYQIDHDLAIGVIDDIFILNLSQ